MYFHEWRPYVSAAERRRRAERELAKLRKKGHPVAPVVIEGRAIARTFWGKAWCDNLERYSDYENRLPRGRTYARNGSVIDLQISPGEVQALVNGSELYRVAVKVTAVPKPRWTSICSDSADAIESLVELLQGRFSQGVMQRLCQEKTGLFPAPAEIDFSCSCPDWASMCKHVAAVLYGIGARLDQQPELLFRLRKVNEQDLIAKAGSGVALTKRGPVAERILVDDGLSELFGIDLGASAQAAKSKLAPGPTQGARGQARSKSAGKGRKKARSTKPAKAESRKTSQVANKKRAKSTMTRKQAVEGADLEQVLLGQDPELRQLIRARRRSRGALVSHASLKAEAERELVRKRQGGHAHGESKSGGRKK